MQKAIKQMKKKEQLVWDAGSVQLEMEKLSDGVYAYYPTDAREKNPKGYPVATSGGFVVGDKGVLVIESMVNKRLAEPQGGAVKRRMFEPELFEPPKRKAGLGKTFSHLAPPPGGAKGGTRTPTVAHWILNPARLPIPPPSPSRF